jgi:hypothetical protein
MKAIKFLLGLGLMVASSSVFSQGLDGIVVEKYYQANAADVANAVAQGAVTPLTTNSVTYRVYVDLAAGYKFNLLFGDASKNLTVSTTTAFFNDPNYGTSLNPTNSAVTGGNIRKNTAMIDSWFTTGGAAGSKAGVLKSEDTDGTLANVQGILANNPGGCFGLPINGATGQDGFLPSSASTVITPNALGLGTAIDVLDQINGGSIVINAGSIAALGGVVGATSSNMVLIGQFTTDGQFSFALNIQIQNIATGVSYDYVAGTPGAGQLTHPTLTLVPNVAPTVSVAASPASAAIINGTAMTFTATAADANGTVSSVSFYDGATLLGTDVSAPFTQSYTAVAGSHSITAVATDNDCVSTTSSAVTFTSAANQAPTVTVTAPTTTVAGTVLTFTASASDVDGTVSQVEFFVNNVSVGVDTSTPYSVTYTAVLGSGQAVKAVATDDLGLTGTSNIVTMNVLANVPATVSMTGPSASGIYSSYVNAGAGTLTPMTFTADAADSDGTVTQVEFFVGGVSVGVDATTPYSVIWNSTSGTKVVTAKATDSNGAITTSATLTLVINDLLALPYEVVSVSQTCELPTYCVPVAAALTNPVNDVKGYDVVMNYDATKVVPTGNVTVYSALVNPALIDVATSFISGELTISLSFKGTAPANSEFNGTGNLFCAEFTRLAGLAPFDQSQVSVSFMQESYITGVQQKPVSANNIFSTTQQNYVSNLQYGFDGSAIAYNSASPNTYLVTNIFGSIDGTAISNPTTPVTPNVAGQFTHNLGNGTNVSIQRDINNLNSIQLIVNASDAVIAKSLLINQFTSANAPSVYQMLSMDVNLDGVISSGDLTQMKQRTTLAIPEYQQAWNYNNQGVSNGQASKDWIFVDAARVATAAYQISATFPANNLIGYSKGKVPVIPFILAANQTGYSVTNATCPLVGTETYKGVMLGDADGSYGAYAADGILKTNESDYILVDLGNAIVEGTTVSVPVAFVSEEPVNAFDIALQVNENKLTYVSMEDTQLGSESDAFYNNNDKTFRYTALNMNDFSSNARVAYFTFETVDGTISDKDLTAELGLLNGKQTEVRFVKSIQVGNNAVDIYPNPSNGMFTVMSNLDGRVDIVDVTGNLVHPGVVVKANQMIEVNMPELSAGVYFVRLFSNNSMTTERIVISE